MTEQQPKKAGVWRLIFYAFFQPAYLTRELEPAIDGFLMLRLMLPIFLVTYPGVLLFNGTVILCGLANYKSVVHFFLDPAIFILLAMMLGMIIALGLNILLDLNNIGLGAALGIVLGMGLGLGSGVVFGMRSSIVLSIGSDVLFGIMIGMVIGWFLGLGLEIRSGITFSVGWFLGMGIGICAIQTLGLDIWWNIRLSIVLGIGIMIGTYRVLLYLVSGPSVLYAYMKGQKQPSKALLLLKHSALHWDERVYLPFPFLMQTLLLAYSEQPQETLEEIAFIAAERPLQLRVARDAALEIAIQDLEAMKSISQIAGAAHRLNEILPPETKLNDPRWASALFKLGNASREAMRSLQPIGRQARLKAIDRMIEELHKIRPNIAFRDQRINRRARRIIEVSIISTYFSEYTRRRIYLSRR